MRRRGSLGIRRGPALGAASLLLAACASGAGDAPLPTSAAASASAAATTSASAAPPPSARPRPADGPLAAGALMADVAWLAGEELHGRGSFTPDEARTAERLARLLDEGGLEKLDGARVLPFEHQGRASANVAAWIGPPAASDAQEIVILGAHYDHLGVRAGATYPGAEDNASGVAVALGVARSLAARKDTLKRPVLVLFFGAEEAWMRGSEAFAASWDFRRRPVRAMVNLDMVGRPLVDQPLLWIGARALGVLPGVDPRRALGVLVSKNAPTSFVDLVRATSQAHGLSAVLVSDLPPDLRPLIEDMARDRSDQAPFERRGVATLFFGAGESSDYHQPSDTVDKLDPELLALRAQAIADTVAALAR